MKIEICNKKQLKSLTIVHYGHKKYYPNKLKPIININWVKPHGRLWCSPIDSEWGWKDWCVSEKFRDCDNKNSFNLKFYDWAKIIIIDSYKDLEKLPLIDCSFNKHFKKHYPDFELLSKNYDGIWLTENGQNETHFSSFKFNSGLDLYGWDCETVFIMNPKCCYQFKQYKKK